MVLLRFMACERHALLASPFVMFAPLMLRYGYEIRMYSLIPFLSVLGTYLLLRAMREDGMRPDRRRSGRGSTALRRIADRRWWIAYAIVVALGMYSQYMMAFVWMTHVLWLYVALRRHGHARRFPRMLNSLRARRGAVHSMDSFRGRPVRLLGFAPVEGDHESE